MSPTLYDYYMQKLQPKFQEKRSILEAAFRTLYIEHSKNPTLLMVNDFMWTPFYNSTGRAGFLIQISNLEETMNNGNIQDTFSNFIDILYKKYGSLAHVIPISGIWLSSVNTYRAGSPLTQEDEDYMYIIHLFILNKIHHEVVEDASLTKLDLSKYTVMLRIEFFTDIINTPDGVRLYLGYIESLIYPVKNYINKNPYSRKRQNEITKLKTADNLLPPIQYDILFNPTEDIDIHYYLYACVSNCTQVISDIQHFLSNFSSKWGLQTNTTSIKNLHNSIALYDLCVELYSSTDRSFGYLNKMMCTHMYDFDTNPTQDFVFDLFKYDITLPNRFRDICNKLLKDGILNTTVIYLHTKEDSNICVLFLSDINNILRRYSQIESF